MSIEAPEIVTIEEARSRGLRWYFTGKPCLRGHIAKRKISNSCCDCKGFGTIIENIEADWTPIGGETKIVYTPCAKCHSYGRIANE